MRFELKGLPRNCSDKEILAEIKRVDLIVNKDFLTQEDYEKHGKMSVDGVKKRFGDWQKVLTLAGLGHKYSGPKMISERMRNQKSRNLSDEEILNELKNIAKKLGRDYVTREEIREHSEIISSSIVEIRFGSWISGLKKAGLRTAPAYNKKYSESEYFENLLNVWTYYGRQPITREMAQSPSVISSAGYQKRFGNWRKALEAFVEKMNQDTTESDSETTATVSAEIPKEVIREEIKKHSVLSEDKHEIRLGLRYKILVRDKFKCSRCGASPATDHSCRLHIDHKVPFSKGGRTIFENLHTLCEKCNLGKGNRHLE